eukprot:GSChrysophyteH1.ASY1.ANO1.1594.1 assembled CDS
MSSLAVVVVLVASLLLVAECSSITYIPGVTPSAWDLGEQVMLVANKISSTDSPVVYDYYDLPFCRRDKKAKTSTDNIGESLSGDTTTQSPYILNMQEDKTCLELCSILEEEDDEYITRGFPLGYKVEEESGKEQHYLYNHVKIIPYSVNHSKDASGALLTFDTLYTYDVTWIDIVNSLMIVLFLTGVVAMIMLRTLHKDISSYNELQTLEEAQEESGWKLILVMTFCTMICALFGLASPANRGGLLTTFILLYVVMGSFAGYYSARVYKLMNGKLWKRSTLLTAVLYPSLMGGLYTFINFIVASKGSTATIPFSTLISVLCLWFGVSAPLTIEVPVRTNQINRHIPEQLFFIMSAMWLHQIYYVFGFLFAVLIILIITCAEITIVLCYFQLCNEDYHAIYLILYSMWYYNAKLKITGFVNAILYFSYMGMVALTFFFLTGTVGFFACLWFVRKIYGAIKVD